MNVTVVTGTLSMISPSKYYIGIEKADLVRLVFLHQRNELLGCPTLRLEIIVIRSGSTSIHLYIHQNLE